MVKLILQILSRLLSRREVIQLATRQRDAVIESLMLTVVPPGHTPAPERLALRLELLALPWATGARGWSASHSAISPRLRYRSDDAGDLLTFARSLGHELTDPGVREQVYRMMVSLALADGGTDRDLPSLDPIRAGLELTVGRAMELVDEVKDAVVAMVL